MTAAYERRGAARVRTADETAESRRRVRGTWFRCEAVTPDDPAGRYLSRRGLPWLVGHPSLRLRPDAPHPSGATLAALVSLIHDGDGDVAALQFTYLNPDGTKAAVDPARTTRGSYSGGAIRIHPPTPCMIVGEGLETCAAAAALLGVPAWSAIAAGNLANRLTLPELVRDVIVAGDNDANGIGQRAAARAARRWEAEGRRVRIALPEVSGQDFNDVLLALPAGVVAHG